MRAEFRLPVLVIWLLPAVALAQEPATSTASRTEAAVAEALDAPYLVRVAKFGAWRARDLAGKPVYDREGKEIGQVTDILITADASVTAVIVDVSYPESGPKTIGLKLSVLTLAPGDAQRRADEVSKANPAVAPAPTAAAAEAAHGAGSSEGRNTQGNDGAIKLGPDGLPERLVADVTPQEVSAAPALPSE